MALATVGGGIDGYPLLRTLLRLRHDVVMLGRAVGCELPAPVTERLAPALSELARVVTGFMHASGTALRNHLPAPPIDHVSAAFVGYTAALESVRHDGLTRAMPSEQVERFFALGFALEQLRDHLADLHRVVDEWAKK